MGPRSRAVIYARDFATIKSCPHVGMSLQNIVQRKKTHEVHTRYLASDVQADILAWLGYQQRIYSVSKFYKVELSSMQWN